MITVLRVYGAVDRSLEWAIDDFDQVPLEQRVPDMAVIEPGRQGRAVRFEAIMCAAGTHSDATFVTLHASRDDFHASIPIETIRDRSLVIYRLEEGPLPESMGGPVRFFIIDPAACRSDAVDECASVKYLDAIEFTRERGLDTRPATETEHADLHAS